MVDVRDAGFMERALFVAERGRGRTTPNPIVGAVVVSSRGVVVGQGAHTEAGGPHAEIVALDQAGSDARDGTLYCTLEPCSHVGRTGPCVERIAGARIARVVFAVRDPNPRVSGSGAAYLRAHGIDVTEGVGDAEARRQNAPFFTWVTKLRPYVILKAAVSTDGFVGRSDGRVKLTAAKADRYLQRQRSEVDAIAVGSGTVLTDDPWLTARGAYRYRPLTRIIFDWGGQVPPSARVFSTLEAGPVIMIVSAQAAQMNPVPLVSLERRGVLIDRREDRTLAPLLKWLGARGVLSLLVEGGPTLQRAFVSEGLVDRVQLIVTPHTLGDGVRLVLGAGDHLEWSAPPTMRTLGDDLLVELDVHGTD
ncbi:MAG TPA: bifunctional diaminohydroxyphosphoribosylaminopyrimidine deaminase/5-amino-6-(5-phosphoribosylamino)uracil reductase RibD [Vicinamibacterales bacterium]|nr:bifunctional diaminohydroxyphosphoribosylaminopyrimidine deaminase/5-amino-6-(5-phosphoribosylamino)uracil reductase RibD [Vicinamibacterales bacterium]